MHDAQNSDCHAVTLLGGGPVDPDDLGRAIALAPRIVAADGGAQHADRLGLPVSEIVGDLDSLTKKELWRKSGTVITQLDEQDSTDFEKCLYATRAPVYVGLGFLGLRLDHTLACLRTLAAYPHKRVILMGEAEIAFHCGHSFAFDAEPGERVSLFPMSAVSAIGSTGLRWPIDGLDFAPHAQIGTSNMALGGAVTLAFGDEGMIAILEKRRLEPVFSALMASGEA